MDDLEFERLRVWRLAEELSMIHDLMAILLPDVGAALVEFGLQRRRKGNEPKTRFAIQSEIRRIRLGLPSDITPEALDERTGDAMERT